MKASGESALEVGDKANDAVRVDGEQLRARVVGEGGNLGLTQRGRVEYALTGGRVNTDAIDNSAGVDTSDHEVNIKIALNSVVDAGELEAADRAALLGEMTDDVAVAVLGNNHAQNATLAAEVTSARSLLDAHERFIRNLERSGRLLRSVEALPDDRQLAERRRDGHALTSPELSVLLAYAKLQTGTEVLASGLPDDPALEGLLIDYFPAPLRERFPAAVTGHPLRREIIATVLTNRAVNIAGVTGLFRLTQETGAPLARVVLAHAVARAVFDVDRLWDAVRPLDNVVSATTQVELRIEATRLAERTARWILRLPELADDPAPAIADVRDRFAAPVAAVRAGLPRLAARQRGRGVRGTRRPAAGGRGAAGAGRGGGRRAAAARRPGPGGGQRADRRARRAGRAGPAVPGRAARAGAAARAGHRAPAGPPLAVDGPGVAAGRPRHGAGVAHRGRAVPAHGRHGPAGEAGRRLGGGLGHHPGPLGRAARRHRGGGPARARRAAGRRPHAARPAQAPPGPPPPPPRRSSRRPRR